jgi:DNA/RNA-binding domain of Phe-tRNA-synthetase-like protein
MKSIVSPEVFELFPGYIRGVVIGKNIDNSGENPRLVQQLREIEEKTVNDESLKDVRNHPRIASWRQAYTALEINPNKYPSSIESLCKRAVKGGQLPYINTAVALFNYFSLKHIVPSGGDDLSSVKGDLRLMKAKGDEPFTPFNSDVVEYPLPGEITYADDNAVMCRRWNWRQGDHTKLLPETKHIAVNIDCLPPVTPHEAEMVTLEMVQLMKEFCGGEISYHILRPGQNEAEI